ncbi:MAG: cupredoxin domain-containing protein [Chloroflexi bacterium]|nr:cupredoxin domain-containing protein [Chloroflexota bacterium]
MFSTVKTVVVLGVSGLTALALTACGEAQPPAPRQVALTASNYQYAPREVTVKAGEKVRLVVTNNSNTKHNFHIDGQKIETDVESGQSKTVEWTVPSKTGEIDFGCETHEKQGMKGKFKVE